MTKKLMIVFGVFVFFILCCALLAALSSAAGNHIPHYEFAAYIALWGSIMCRVDLDER